MLLLQVLVLIIAVPVLGRSSDLFVAAASQVSLRYRVPPVVVGAVVIGFGTSLPEALTSIMASLDGSLDVAVGNVVGSNVANLTLVLGGAALLCTITFPPPILRREVALVLVSAVGFALLSVDGYLGRTDAAVLLVGMCVALWMMLRAARQGDRELALEVVEFTGPPAHLFSIWMRLVIGALGVVGGAYVLLWSAIGLADYAGLSGGFVGVSIVAIGTSLPEMVTSYQAARRREGELIVGNLLGSNVFNTLFVAPAAALVGPGQVSFYLAGPATWVMVTVTLLVGLVALCLRRLPRAVIPLLVAGYAATLIISA